MKIPTILSGPIIRRVEPTQVYIWIATNSRFWIEAKIYQITQENREKDLFYEHFSTYTKTQTIRAGDNLYINLIKVIPNAGTFPTDALLGYNLFLSGENDMFDLSNFNLLSPDNPQSIVYGNLKYPSFYIQKSLPCNVLYGSCRKPHGKGNDVYHSADQTIHENYLNLNHRPSALFLMGDQIYADDVADPLFHVLSSWSEHLAGENKEQLSNVNQNLELLPFQTSIDKIHSRQYIMETFCKFTSGNADNHLMRFSEYAAMYLMTFGPQLWENAIEESYLPSFTELLTNNDYYFMYPKTEQYGNEHVKEVERHQQRYHDQFEELIPFISNLGSVRRVLANTPTYMIFDDHDITDDWNITSDWKTNVLQAPLGKHVIANGLSAYWLFQGWGNEPDTFDETFINTMREYFSSFSTQTPIYEQWIHQLLEFNSWYFVAPTNPTGLFLDTRTMRGYELTPSPIRIGNIVNEGSNAPELIDRSGWKNTITHFNKNGWTEGESLIIVSPTPLYGIGLIESFLHRYVYPIRTLGIPIDYTLDFEAWKYNGKGFNRFLEHISLLDPSDCFILSGDVHYAGAVKSEVEFSDQQKITIHQFTSSPIHNISFSGLWGLLMKIAVWFNGLKRKKRVIHRSCDTDNNLVLEHEDSPCSDKQKWKEKIQYLTSSTGSIIETNNNLGCLTLKPILIENKLLTYDGENKREISFDSR